MHPRQRFSAKQLDEQVRTIRVLGVFAFALFLCLVAAWLIQDDAPVGRSAAPPTRVTDPHHAELVRCGAIGSPALDDPACRHAWAENRRRFFGSPAAQPPTENGRRGEPLPTPEEAR